MTVCNCCQGACCDPVLGCSLATAALCAEIEGAVFQGAGTTCDPDPCACGCDDVDLATALYGIESYSWDIVRGASRSRYNTPGDPSSGTALIGSGASTGSYAAGYGRVKGCVRWLCRCVDENGNVLCSKTIGSPTVDLTAELEAYTDYLPETEAGCYVYSFEFFGWLKPGGTTLGGTIGAEPIWIDSSDAYKVIQTKIS